MEKNKYKHLTDGQKLKLISFIGGFETRVEGCEHGMEKMYYRIIPNKKLVFLITSEKVYHHDKEEHKLAGYILQFIDFAKQALQKYSSDKELKGDDLRSYEFFVKELSFSYEVRNSHLHLTPEKLTHIAEDPNLVGASASEAIDKLFTLLVSGKLFLSLNVKDGEATISRWQDEAVVNEVYKLHPEYPLHYVTLLCSNGFTIPGITKPIKADNILLRLLSRVLPRILYMRMKSAL